MGNEWRDADCTNTNHFVCAVPAGTAGENIIKNSQISEQFLSEKVNSMRQLPDQ